MSTSSLIRRITVIKALTLIREDNNHYKNVIIDKRNNYDIKNITDEVENNIVSDEKNIQYKNHIYN